MLAEGSLYNLRISPRSFLQPVKRARYVVAAEGGCRVSFQIFDHPTLRQCPTSLKSLVKTHFTSIYFRYRSSLAYNIQTNKTQTRHILKKIRMIKWMQISRDQFTSRLQTGEIFMVSLCGPSSWLQQNGIQKISVCTSAPMCQPQHLESHYFYGHFRARVEWWPFSWHKQKIFVRRKILISAKKLANSYIYESQNPWHMILFWSPSSVFRLPSYSRNEWEVLSSISSPHRPLNELAGFHRQDRKSNWTPNL